MKKINIKKFKEGVSAYVLSNRVGESYQFKMSDTGSTTLYSSCFAAMTLHYCDYLSRFSAVEKKHWASYLNSFQDAETGYYLAPEIMGGQFPVAITMKSTYCYTWLPYITRAGCP